MEAPQAVRQLNPVDNSRVRPGRTPQALGQWGETVAARFLVERGWTVLARNYRAGRKEIDIVARRHGIVAFVEVKTRRGLGFGHPLEAITRLKRREISEVARDWLRRNPGAATTVRFDAIGILSRGSGVPFIEHFPDAWQAGD